MQSKPGFKDLCGGVTPAGSPSRHLMPVSFPRSLQLNRRVVEVLPATLNGFVFRLKSMPSHLWQGVGVVARRLHRIFLHGACHFRLRITDIVFHTGVSDRRNAWIMYTLRSYL